MQRYMSLHKLVTTSKNTVAQKVGLPLSSMKVQYHSQKDLSAVRSDSVPAKKSPDIHQTNIDRKTKAIVANATDSG